MVSEQQVRPPFAEMAIGICICRYPGQQRGMKRPCLQSRRRRHRLYLRRPLFLEQFGKQERKVDCLLRVKSWIADSVIAVVQIGLGNGARAASTFGHVLPGHLQMDATGVSALSLMHLEEPAYFF